MFIKGSRYESAQNFERRANEAELFRGVRPRKIGHAGGVIEHMVRVGDRLDLLARHYYNDDRLWWRIVDANPEFLFGNDMMVEAMRGMTLLIPKARE